jgi:hypothetical protein
VLAIALVLASAALVGAGTGMAVQLAKGYTALDPFHYLVWFALPLTVSAIHLAVLSVFVQVLVPQKFVGWADGPLFGPQRGPRGGRIRAQSLQLWW